MEEKKFFVKEDAGELKISIPLSDSVTSVDVSQSAGEFVQYAFLKDSFFAKKEYNQQLLDVSKAARERESRAYVCLILKDEFNTYLIPLKTSIKDQVNDPTLNGTYYEVPSTARPYAGLDYRKIILVNDSNDYTIEEAKISAAQKKIIQDNFEEIKKGAIKYIEEFKKVAQKKRIDRERKFRFAALSNFLEELGVD